MKSVLFSFLLLGSFLFSTHADARSVIIDIGGVRHQCTPMNNGNPFECIETAYRGPFSRSESETLCAGAFSSSPALCAIEAYRGRFSKSDSINLCIGATTDNGPIDCANAAYNGPFSLSESLEICSNNGSERNAVCAIKAYSGSYSKAEAIKICKSTNFLDEKEMAFNVSKSEFDRLIKAANEKAVRNGEYK
jgi:hypothetical protein